VRGAARVQSSLSAMAYATKIKLAKKNFSNDVRKMFADESDVRFALQSRRWARAPACRLCANRGYADVNQEMASPNDAEHA
jgi:hypothetical protein